MKPRFTIRSLLIFTAVAGLYLQTWCGGYRAQVRREAREAHERYDRVAERNRQRGYESVFTELHPNGPRSGVDFCVPIFPGVLWVDTFYGLGPLCAAGRTKIVIYDLWETHTVFERLIWIT